MLIRSFLALLLAAPTVFAQTVEAPKPFGDEGLRTFPFSMIGRLVFSQGDAWYQGSGTLLRPRSVLTAAHNLWDADQGFSTDLLFQRALSGEQAASHQFASRIYVLSGYREAARRHGAADVRAFAFDLGAVLFDTPVGGGAHAGWWANPAALIGAKPSVALGYGAQFHSGSELLSVAPTDGFEPIAGAFYDSRTLFFESGMSGGPVFGQNAEGAWLLAGVVVAGTADSNAGGVRVLDATAAAFIREYLK